MRCLHLDIGGIAPLIRIRQVIVDFAVGYQNAAFHLAFAQARQCDFVANLLAKLGPADAIPLERRAEILQGKTIPFRDAAHCRIELDVGNPQTGFLGKLQLDAVGNHALEKLPLERIARRQLDVLRSQLPLYHREAGAQFESGNRIVIDHGNDAVHLDRLRAPGLGLRRLKQKAGKKNGGQKTKNHGVVSGLSVLCWLITP